MRKKPPTHDAKGRPLRRDGKRRKPNTFTHTEARYRWMKKFWEPVKSKLRLYLQANPGAQTRMARAIGISDSQLHRYSCPVCEHDQEASFSIGMAIVLYIEKETRSPIREMQIRKPRMPFK